MLYDRRAERSRISPKALTERDELAWSPDSKTIYFTAENETQRAVYRGGARGSGSRKKLSRTPITPRFSFRADGKTLVFERTSLTMAGGSFRAASDGSNVRQLTHQNESILAGLEMNARGTFWFDGPRTKVQAMLIRPPKFDATKKYPLLVLLHGGRRRCVECVGIPVGKPKFFPQRDT